MWKKCIRYNYYNKCFLLVLSLRVPSGRVAAEYQFVARIFFIFWEPKTSFGT